MSQCKTCETRYNVEQCDVCLNRFCINCLRSYCSCGNFELCKDCSDPKTRDIKRCKICDLECCKSCLVEVDLPHVNNKSVTICRNCDRIITYNY